MQNANEHFVILSDSLSCPVCRASSSSGFLHYFFFPPANRYWQANCFMLLPSHIGLAGNASADAAAKAALNLPEAQILVPYSDVYPLNK